MLEKNRMVFDKTIQEYARDLLTFIQERLNPHEITESVEIIKGRRNGRETIEMVIVHLDGRKFENPEASPYSVTIKEKVRPLNDTQIFTKKYSYEIYNDKDPYNDFVRFDYQPYDTYPHLHINSNEKIWGNHLTYPESINLDLEKLDVIKALNIFQRFVCHDNYHILDKNNNKTYIDIIEGGSTID